MAAYQLKTEIQKNNNKFYISNQLYFTARQKK